MHKQAIAIGLVLLFVGCLAAEPKPSAETLKTAVQQASTNGSKTVANASEANQNVANVSVARAASACGKAATDDYGLVRGQNLSIEFASAWVKNETVRGRWVFHNTTNWVFDNETGSYGSQYHGNEAVEGNLTVAYCTNVAQPILIGWYNVTLVYDAGSWNDSSGTCWRLMKPTEWQSTVGAVDGTPMLGVGTFEARAGWNTTVRTTFDNGPSLRFDDTVGRGRHEGCT